MTNIKVEQLVRDITGTVNRGLPMQVTKIENELAEVFYLEGQEHTHKHTWVELKNLI